MEDPEQTLLALAMVHSAMANPLHSLRRPGPQDAAESGRRAGSAVRGAVEAESAHARETASDRARRSPSESRPGSAGGVSPPASASPTDALEKTENPLHSLSRPGPQDAADTSDHPTVRRPELPPRSDSDRRSARCRGCRGGEDLGSACSSRPSPCQSPSGRTRPCEHPDLLRGLG